jgi:uncharacterized protein (TIGR02588 family)
MKRNNLLELGVLALSVGAIAVLVGVLVLEGVNESRPPSPSVVTHTDQARETDLGWVLPATARNDGDQAAEAVVLEATAVVEGQEESSEIEIAFLPGGSEVEIAFAFSGRPEGEVELRLVGFRLP